MSLRDALNLIEGEQAWHCDVVRVEHGTVTEIVDHGGWMAVLKPIAARLYLEVHEVEGRLALVHRAGWPFDLNTFAGDPVGAAVATLRPTGAGDEVMRDLIESFEAAAPCCSLHIHAD